MDRKILGIGVGVAISVVIITIAMFPSNSEPIEIQKTNEKIGLVINPPNQSVTLQEINEIFSTVDNSFRFGYLVTIC